MTFRPCGRSSAAVLGRFIRGLRATIAVVTVEVVDPKASKDAVLSVLSRAHKLPNVTCVGVVVNPAHDSVLEARPSCSMQRMCNAQSVSQCELVWACMRCW